MSKQDSHFFNNFSLILGILFAVTIGLFAFARHVGAEHQGKQVTTDPRYLAGVDQRLKPVAQVAVEGEDNSALDPPKVVIVLPADGAAAYSEVCTACHALGIAGAPKVGDKAAWGPRIAQGKSTLYQHALKGYNGKTGVMPAKGGKIAWPDELVQQTVDYMVEQSK